MANTPRFVNYKGDLHASEDHFRCLPRRRTGRGLVGHLEGNLSAPSGSGVLSVLAKGQPVNLKDAAGRYTITILPKGPDTLPYKISEIGQDYVVVQDSVGITELRIPLWSIKEVQVLKVGGR